MASTPVHFLRPYPSTLTAKLTSAGGTGTPHVDGYTCTNTNGLQVFTVTQALVGLFYVYIHDAGGEIAYTGYVTLADTTDIHRVVDDLLTWQVATSTDSLIPAIKAKTDLLGTIRSLIRW